jgi:hypothetical protein
VIVLRPVTPKESLGLGVAIDPDAAVYYSIRINGTDHNRQTIYRSKNQQVTPVGDLV